jgi:tetratricopeptide (TPR) repeat protein
MDQSKTPSDESPKATSESLEQIPTQTTPGAIPKKKRDLKHVLNRTLSSIVWTALVVIAIGIAVIASARRVLYFWTPQHTAMLVDARRYVGVLCIIALLLSGIRIFLRTEKKQRDYAKIIATICSLVGLGITIATPYAPYVTEQEFTDLQNANRNVADPPISTPEGLKRIARGVALSKSDDLTRAQGELGLEHYPEAIRLLDEGSSPLTKELADAHFYKASALWAWGRYDTTKYESALSEAELSLVLRPMYSPALVIECESLRNLVTRPNHLEDALNACDDAIRADPKNAGAYNGKGGVLVRLKQYQDAITNFDIGISLNPAMPQLWSNRAVAKHKLPQGPDHAEDKLALSDVNWALHLAPNFKDALLNKATIMKSLGDLDGALAIYQQMTEADPQDDYAWNNLGEILEKKNPGDTQTLLAALGKFNQALQIDPNYEDALFNKGNALVQLGRYQEAIEPLTSACNLDKSDEDAIADLSFALSKVGRTAEARAAARRTLALNPSDKIAKLVLAGR